jgi:hypothetical protein
MCSPERGLEHNAELPSLVDGSAGEVVPRDPVREPEVVLDQAAAAGLATDLLILIDDEDAEAFGAGADRDREDAEDITNDDKVEMVGVFGSRSF